MTQVLRLMCGRCGSLIGRTEDEREAARIQREHLADCELDP